MSLRGRNLILLPLAVALASLALLGLTSGAGSGAAAATPASGDFAGQVTIADGRRIYLECSGVGTPTVILISGLRGSGNGWAHAEVGSPIGAVFPNLSALTRTCVYDRPGTVVGDRAVGRTDPVPMPRTVADTVVELHALLLAAGLPGPYVMAGSSTGGLIERLYASTYPAEVAGLVMVDAISEGVRQAMTRKMWGVYNRRFLIEAVPELAGYPGLETIDFGASFRQMRRAGVKPPPLIPFVVISKKRPFGVPTNVPHGFSRALEYGWNQGQRYLVRLVPRARRIIASQSGHRILFEQPELVIREVVGVIAQVRG